MTQKELEVIINSDLPSNKKSELIKQLYDIERTDVQAFEKGGKISEEKVESAAEKISRLIEEVIKPAAENGNKTALRLMNIDKNFYTFTEEDVEKGYKGNAGDKGNVYITSRGEYITPGIRYVDGILQFVGDNEPWSEDVELQSIKFPSEEDARFFGENYHNYPELIPTL